MADDAITVTQELKPCPFCGGEAQRFTLTEEDEPMNAGGDVITCLKCQASSHVEFGRKENLVSCWNTRTTSIAAQDGLVEENERLRKLVQTYRGAQLRAEEKLCREQANAKGWKVRAERLEAKLAAHDGLDQKELPEVAAMRFIEILRSDIAASVTILTDNEDANYKSEQVAIEVCAEWTNWRDYRIYGESVLQCLAKAVGEREALSAIRENKAAQSNPIMLQIAAASDEHEMWAQRYKELCRIYPSERIFSDDGGKWGLRDFLSYAAEAMGISAIRENKS